MDMDGEFPSEISSLDLFRSKLFFSVMVVDAHDSILLILL